MFGFRRKKDIDIGRIKDEFRDEIEQIVGKKEYREFKKFAFKRNIVEMAIAFMMGAAFHKVIHSISAHLLLPLINYVWVASGSNLKEYIFAPAPRLGI